MKVKVITLATYDSPELDRLLLGAVDRNVEIHVIETIWKGFGTKVIETIDYVKTLEDYTHFIFVDAYDVIFIKGLDYIMDNYEGGILFSTEKACWPDPNKASLYPDSKSEWKYLNSGSYIAPIKEFLEVISHYPVNYSDDDQAYFTNIFLDGKINLDYDCKIFQSIAFMAQDDFKVTDKELINLKTNTSPAIIHGNGRTPMDIVSHLNYE